MEYNDEFYLNLIATGILNGELILNTNVITIYGDNYSPATYKHDLKIISKHDIDTILVTDYEITLVIYSDDASINNNINYKTSIKLNKKYYNCKIDDEDCIIIKNDILTDEIIEKINADIIYNKLSNGCKI